jgi:serine/threonine-protein kinase RsbW
MPTATFPGRYDSLIKISEFVNNSAQAAHLSDFDIYAVETAVDEACSNIIEHAYGGENKGEICCTIKTDGQGLTIILKDRGRPFNPAKVKPPNLEAKLNNRRTHGLGLYFIYKLMDEVDFRFNDDGNTLVMIKHPKNGTENKR